MWLVGSPVYYMWLVGSPIYPPPPIPVGSPFRCVIWVAVPPRWHEMTRQQSFLVIKRAS
ncbi:hypothetical protein RchiOBHm_Chr2g0129901 [Rosa chinensis]|uniref:Uncharacterized protein n=1 Tax=Rosa chinensis TaxID=74649 RepID=A0A2P6RUN7_ROSCH|nr:hypothetical protein RchiOBHm_Chr2g0129901 [Rosa chinensis]